MARGQPASSTVPEDRPTPTTGCPPRDPPAPASGAPGASRPRSRRRPTYKVKANDTLRSIARDTLSDSRRAGEIYNLNRDLLDDPKRSPTPGPP